MELPLAIIVTLGTIRPEDSGAVFEQNEQVSRRLGMPGLNPIDMLITPYWASEEKYSHQPHHGLSPLTSYYVHHSSHHMTSLFLLHYNVTLMTISAEKYISLNSIFQLFRDTPTRVIIQFLRKCNLYNLFKLL